jgi:hypothetical protein
MQISEKFADAPKGRTAPKANNGQCVPLQAPMYEIPISPESKKAYDSAMKVAMNEPGSPPIQPSPMRKVDMSGVQGLYDDDLDQYLHINAMKSASIPASSAPLTQKGPAPAGFNSATNTPFSEAMATFSPSPAGGRPVLHYEAQPTTDKWQYITDLLLFIAAGVLVIFLCDLLFKIALSIGMKDTFQMMEPYLREIAELKAMVAATKQGAIAA